MPIPNNEQISSPIMMLFFSYLDPIVFKAHRVPHLLYEELPPLADYDYANVLKDHSFKVRSIETFPRFSFQPLFSGPILNYY
jgi:hypothetical protein